MSKCIPTNTVPYVNIITATILGCPIAHSPKPPKMEAIAMMMMNDEIVFIVISF
jgi:hypothetical protein